jgi:hypothetical protein
MTNYERLMRELALLAALAPYANMTDTSEVKRPFSLAWKTAHERASRAADEYAASPDS